MPKPGSHSPDLGIQLALVHAFLQTGTEHHVDLQFDIDSKEEKRVRLVELINNALSEQ